MMTMAQETQWSNQEIIPESRPLFSGWSGQGTGTIAVFGGGEQNTPSTPYKGLSVQHFATNPSFSVHSLQWTAIRNTNGPVAATTTSHRLRNDVRAALERIRAQYTQRTREQLEATWLIENRHAYVGQWIALQGDELLAHSVVAREVFAIAKGMKTKPLVMKIERDDLPFGGW